MRKTHQSTEKTLPHAAVTASHQHVRPGRNNLVCSMVVLFMDICQQKLLCTDVAAKDFLRSGSMIEILTATKISFHFAAGYSSFRRQNDSLVKGKRRLNPLV